MTWKPEKFEIATKEGPNRIWGHVYRGLGFHLTCSGSPAGRRPPVWTVTHLGTGHRVAFIHAARPRALALATVIAELGDWTFDGLGGWKNIEPELAQRFHALKESLPSEIKTLQTGQHEDQARDIAARRSA